MLQALSSWKNQTVPHCLKHHRIYMFSDFRFHWGKSPLHLIGFPGESKMKSFREAANKEFCFILYLEKRKTFYEIILAIELYHGSIKNTFFCRISVTKKKIPRKTSPPQKKMTSLWKCAILLTFLAKKVTCNILKI